MIRETWYRDAFLLVTSFVALGGLAWFLADSQQINTPETFHPNSQQSSSIRTVASKIDESFQEQWQQAGIQPTTRADDLIILRRLALGLAGTIPSVEEIRAIEKIPSDQRIEWYVSRLLADRRSSDYLAERLARAYVGVEEGPFLVFRRRRFVSWLSDQLQQNRRYDALAREILTDDGLWTDSPAVNFITYNIVDDQGQPDPIRLAGRTSRAFLGMRIDCLQCHDDFLGTINLGSDDDPVGGMQVHFHSLAAYFSQVRTSITGVRDDLSAEPYEYQLLDESQPKVIAPSVPFQPELQGTESRLRLRLANWVTHPENEMFARATVNRFWAILYGRGLVDPVDDIPLHEPVPAALDILARDFVASGYDIQRLIRIMVQTRVFQLASTADFEITDEHEENWAVFPLIRLRPDQVAGAIAQSTSLVTIDSTSHVVSRLMQYGLLTSFINRYGDPGEDEFSDRGETVSQRLLLMNGDMVGERLENGFLAPSHLAGLAPSPDRALEVVYLSTLTRRPTLAERQHFLPQIEELYGNDRTRRIQDIYWTLINSIEFVWNH